MSTENFTLRRGKVSLCQGTFYRQEVVYGQFQTLPPPEHTYRVPLIIIQILTCKNGLGTFACGTVHTIVNTHTHIHTPATDNIQDSLKGGVGVGAEGS